MDASKVKQIAAEWSQWLCKKNIPHVVVGSVAMLLHECKPSRARFKDVDFLLPDDRAQEMKDTLVESGFIMNKKKNYERTGVTIGVATDKTHPGFPSPIDDSERTKIGDVWVLTLDALIRTKSLAVESLMRTIVERGYRRYREKSVTKQLKDVCALCRKRQGDRLPGNDT